MASSEKRGALQWTLWALHKVWVGAMRRCPKCEQGKMYESYYGIRKTCPSCGVVLQPYEGDSLGVYAVSYFLALVPAVLVCIFCFFQLHMSAYGVLAVFAGVSGAVLFGLFPQMKGIWIACVYLMTGLKPPRMRGL